MAPAEPSASPGGAAEDRLTLEAVAILALAAVALFVMADALETVLGLHTALPYWNGWAPIIEWDELKSGNFAASDWFGQHNEHRPVFARLFYFLDLAVFGGRNVVQGPLVLLTQLSVAALFSGAAFFLFRRREGWPAIISVCAIVAFAMQFSMAQVENFVLPFNLHWVLGYGMAAWALALAAAVPEQAGARRSALLGGAIVLALCAHLSVAFALMAWPAMLGIGLSLRFRRSELVAVAVAGTLVSAAYYATYDAPSGLGSPSDLVTRPFDTILFFLSVLGDPLQPVAGTLLARLAGIFGIGAVAWLMADLRLRPRAYGAAGTLLVAEMAFVLLATLFITLLHAPEGAAEAEAPRYAVGPAAFWTCLLVLGWQVALRRVRGPMAMRVPQAAAAILVLIAAATPWQSVDPWRRELTGLAATADAMRVGVYDDTALARVYPAARVDEIYPLIEVLRERDLSVFHGSDDSEIIGRQMEEVFFLSPGSCAGFFDSVLDARSDAGAGVAGWAWDRVNKQTVAKVVIADADGTLIGLATTSTPRPDVLQNAAEVNSADTGWFGYSRSSEGEATAYAVLPGNAACPLEGAQVVRPGDSVSR
ncbi:MAG: hypothetical protein AB7T37_06105 [Dehalococcoidia bacterium]